MFATEIAVLVIMIIIIALWRLGASCSIAA
jgi:hypothetical protein